MISEDFLDSDKIFSNLPGFLPLSEDSDTFNAEELLFSLEELEKISSKPKIILKTVFDPKESPKLVTCVHCDTPNLYWYKHPGSKRRLFCSKTDEPHVCEGYRFVHEVHQLQIEEYLKDKIRKSCKFCKEKGLYWIEESSGEWRLYDKTLQVHECKQYFEHLDGLKDD